MASAWSSLPKKQRLAIVVAVPLLIVAAFGYFIYKDLAVLGKDPVLYEHAAFIFPPDQKLSGSLWKKIEDLKADIKREELVAAEHDQVKEQLDQIKALREDLRNRLPSAKQKTEVRIMIENMAKEITPEIGRVELIGVQIQEASNTTVRGANTKGELAEEVLYRCSFKADMNGLIYYINRLENSRHFMALADLKVKPGVPGVNKETLEVDYGLHDIDMTIKTYVYREGEG